MKLGTQIYLVQKIFFNYDASSKEIEAFTLVNKQGIQTIFSTIFSKVKILHSSHF